MGDAGRGIGRRRYNKLARITAGVEVEVEVGVRHIVSVAVQRGLMGGRQAIA
jgi:hypothetical protein